MNSKAFQGMGIFRNLQPLILASESPRRKELLNSVGLVPEIVPSRVAETEDPTQSAESLARRWAAEKAQTVSILYPNSWVLGADTIVVLAGGIYGKPAGPAEAEAMLKELSGRTHEVITGIALAHHADQTLRVQSVRTQVTFRSLTDEEIKAYVRSGEPLDKAGAYGIQGIGAFLVQSINGSYTNVVGLPLAETLELLLACEVIVPKC
ncbi:MAG: Maf family protein [Syntrophobacteraceae bacterium]